MNKFIKAFVYAFNGLIIFFKNETNGRLQLIAALAAIALSAFLKISVNEWLCIIICISSVISLEMINSAIEKLCNMINPEFHPAIKIIKDISAASVLWASFFSAIIGTIIFLPKIFS